MIDVLNKYNIGKKKLIGIGIFIALFLIALPLTLIQVQKQQEIRQRAEGLNNVYLELKPSRDGKNAIDTQFVQTLYLQNPQNKDISAVDISLTYNNENLDVVDFITEGNLSDVIKDTSIPGEVHLVGINSSQIHMIDSTIPLGAFIFKAKKEGSGAIDFSKVTVTVTNETQPILPTYSKSGEYEIASKKDPTIVLNGDVNKDKTIDEDDLKTFIDHYSKKEDKFDINGDKIVDGVDYNILLRLSSSNGSYNPATIASINFIQGALAAELPSFVPNVASLKEIPAITTSDLVIWKKTIGILGSTASPALDLLGNFNVVHSLIKAARIKDLTEQISIYDLVEYHAQQGKTIDEILAPYKDKAEIYDGRSLISAKGREYLDNKYDSLLSAYREKCREVKQLKKEGKKANAEDEGACLFPALSEADISELKANEARLITQMGSPILNALAKYDRAVRNGGNGFDEGLEVHYYLAKRFDEKTEYGSAIELYDAVSTSSPSSEIGRLSAQRIRQLHSFGHQANRVFFHIASSFADPTIIIPINMCGPGSVGCKLVGKTVLKPGIIVKNVTKHGAEKVTQLLVMDYGIRKEAADAVIAASFKLAKNEAGGVNFGKLVGKGTKVSLELTPEEVAAFQRDVYEFIISKGEVFRLDDFHSSYPKYKILSLGEIKDHLPEYVRLSEREVLNGGKIFEIRVIPKIAYGKFVYRAEGSGYSEGETSIVKLLKIFKKQGGIGKTNQTFVGRTPGKALSFIHPDGGLWLFKRDIVDSLSIKEAGLADPSEFTVQGIIPFRDVEKLLVTKDIRKQMLKEYGARDTKLFGKPLKDVVIVGIDPDDASLLQRTILDLNLK